jgi:hypothetical protein
MRSMLSVPQQIRRAVLSGDLENALLHARLAHSRNEQELLDEKTTILGAAAVLRQESVEGRLTEQDAVRLARLLIHREVAPFVASLIIIRLATSFPGLLNKEPGCAALEVLDTLAAEQEVLSDLELFHASCSLAE